jgi:2-amino-4-hydroxy-6-hydroxymethyldihydropteridine diphosphokinase
MTCSALIAIGANLSGPDDQEPIDTCRQAAIHLDGLPAARLIGLSRWYATAPIPPSGQPPYINAVALLRFSALRQRRQISAPARRQSCRSKQKLRTCSIKRADSFNLEQVLSAESLLANLQTIETKFGRQRSVANAARTLDLDLISVWDTNGPVLSDHPKMILPHPRAHQRAFVLVPIIDVMPHWRHPRLNQTAQQLLDALEPQDIQPIS